MQGFVFTRCSVLIILRFDAADLLADISIFVAALKVFTLIQDKPLRRRFIYIFSTCSCTTVAAIVRVTLIFTQEPIKAAMAAIVEVSFFYRQSNQIDSYILLQASISLIVCSIPIVANVFYQIGSSDPSSFITTSPPVFLPMKPPTSPPHSQSLFSLVELAPSSSAQSSHVQAISLHPRSLNDSREWPPVMAAHADGHCQTRITAPGY